MTEGGHGGEELERLRTENEQLRTELARLQATMQVQSIVLGTSASQPKQLVEGRPEAALSRATGVWGVAGVVKGGGLVALAAMVGWLGRHWREATAVALVAVVTALVTWWLWGTDEPPQTELIRPPVQTTTATVTRTQTPVQPTVTATTSVVRTVTASPGPAERTTFTPSRQPTTTPTTGGTVTSRAPTSATPTEPLPPSTAPPATITVTTTRSPTTPQGDDDDDELPRQGRICAGAPRPPVVAACVWPTRLQR